MRPDADVLIVGGGLAAQRACQELRRQGYDGRVRVLCDESDLPYDRPPLSKGVLTGERPADAPVLRPRAWYEENEIDLLLGVEACGLDPPAQRVRLSGGGTLRYKHLVIASGSRPRRLAALPIGGMVRQLHTLGDARRLRESLALGIDQLVIVGAGLVGMEVASSATACGVAVTLVEAAPSPLSRAVPPALGRWLADLHTRAGVDVRLATTVERAAEGDGCVHLALGDGANLAADLILVAAGTAPATEWAHGSGLPAGAIEVDAGGRSALIGIYAAGDAAAYPDPATGRHRPSQHWEAAVQQGATVARTIVGAPPRPQAPPMFWSDQHGVRIQLVGSADGADRIEIDGDPAAPDFTAWMVRDEQPIGAVLAGRPYALADARRRIAAAAPRSSAATSTTPMTRRRNGLPTRRGRDRLQRARRL